jgi:hypothetical protein
MSSLPSDKLFELARHVLEANQLTRYALCKSLRTLLYDASALIVIIDLVSSAIIIFYDYGEFSFCVRSRSLSSVNLASDFVRARGISSNARILQLTERFRVGRTNMGIDISFHGMRMLKFRLSV